jgi:hypothetical protein
VIEVPLFKPQLFRDLLAVLGRPSSVRFIISSKEISEVAMKIGEMEEIELKDRYMGGAAVELDGQASIDRLLQVFDLQGEVIGRILEGQKIWVNSNKEDLPLAEDGHKYLQGLIKQIAEGKGYKAIIEAPTSDGLGRVDVSLERDGRRIACEVSVTSSGEQEFSNVQKCLLAGYDRVILCSPEERILEMVRALISQRLSKLEGNRVLLLKPEELFSYLKSEAAALVQDS